MIFIGNPGTGKTHLATAMGIKALMKGFKVLFTPVSEMLNTLNGSRADNTEVLANRHKVQKTA